MAMIMLSWTGSCGFATKTPPLVAAIFLALGLLALLVHEA